MTRRASIEQITWGTSTRIGVSRKGSRKGYRDEFLKQQIRSWSIALVSSGLPVPGRLRVQATSKYSRSFAGNYRKCCAWLRGRIPRMEPIRTVEEAVGTSNDGPSELHMMLIARGIPRLISGHDRCCLFLTLWASTAAAVVKLRGAEQEIETGGF